MPPLTFQLSFDFEMGADGVDQATALLGAAAKLGIVPAKPAAPKAAPAPTKTAAATGNSKSKPKAPPPASDPTKDLLDVAGDSDEDDETGGLGLADDDASGFSGTAAEAREESLAKLRTALANGHKDKIKIVQQKMGVGKFHDVPEEQGYVFLKTVNEVLSQIGRD